MTAADDTKESFERLAAAHLHPLYSMAVRLTRQPQEAEDLVQETLLRAYRFFDKFERGTNFKAWVFKILKNAFINRYRKAQKEPDTVDFDAIEEGLESLVADAPAGAPAPADPERVFFDKVIDGEIEKAIDELPAEFRMVLLMAVVEEMSYKEIATALSIPIGTVMSRLHRARRMLQGRLMEYGRERGMLPPEQKARPGVVDLSRFREKKK